MPDFGDVDPNTGQTSARTQFEGTVDPLAPSLANGQISPEQWEAYRQKRHRAALLGVLSVLGGTTAASGLSSMLFGGSGGALASASVPGAVGAEAAPLGVGSVTASGALPSGIGVATGAGTGGALAAGGDAVSHVMDAKKGIGGMLGGMEGKDIAALIAALGGTIGGALTNKPNTNPSTATMDPALKNLIDLQTKRMTQQQPLFESINAMANGLLPTQYQKGGGAQGGM